ncbi:aminopeptidase P N-terminal domain-containing protein [Polycyclovorans algicola]|uniref:aminopeptidase P N-terminal domain-containing protein n=1 Tax=Polycyclovorans algicola TaxID=616992 RepID=UPI0004A6C158|nr:aminopeptidase P N-terminal domain-containing protein [Polycyclovorans algicola]
MGMPFAERRAALMQAMGPQGVAIIPAAHEQVRSRDTHFPFRQDSDFHYLTGFPEPEAIAVLCPGRTEGEYVLFVRPRNAEREVWDGRRAGPEGAIVRYGADQAHALDAFETELPKLLAGRQTLHYTLAEHGALDGPVTRTLRQLREIARRGAQAPAAIEALEATLHEQRLIKSTGEVALMAEAARISAEAHVRAMQATRPGRNEWEIAAEIERHLLAHRMVPGYTSIVGGGDNACILHYTENNQPLRDGDLLLIDAGGELDGYTADITRTFPVNGRYSGPQRALYDVVLAANIAAIDCLRPGRSVGSPHEAASRILAEGLVDLGLCDGSVDAVIESGALRRFYMHGTGHWLGLDVHDVGRYRQADGEYRNFAPGMVMTVEPGLYIAPGSDGVDPRFHGIGIRIEDDVVVTDGAPRVLTGGVPKDAAAIEALMAQR